MELLIGIGVIVLAVIFIIWFFVSRYQVPKTGQAIVVSGSGGKDGTISKILTKRGAFIVPVIQRCISISLRSRQVQVTCEGISKDKITLNLSVVATFKVGSTNDQIYQAAERFAGNEDEMNAQITSIIEGAMREIVGEMTVVDLIGDRQAFRDSLMKVINDSISRMGLDMDNLAIKEISDDNGYIRNLGRPQEAVIQKDADVSEAENAQIAAEAKIAAQLAIEQKNKEFKLQKAAIDEEVSKRQAEADSAKPIADAQQQKLIQDAQKQVELANVEVTKAKLTGEVNAKADADKYRKLVDAQAQAQAIQEQAKGEAEAKKLQAAADADVTRQTMQAHADGNLMQAKAEADGNLMKAKTNAESIRLEGTAQAEAIKAQGLAEAEKMEKMATAYEKYGKAALASEIIKVLPDIASQIAKPLANANITAINAEASDQVSNLVGDLAGKVPAMVNAMTGINLVDSVKNISENGITVNADKTNVHQIEPDVK